MSSAWPGLSGITELPVSVTLTGQPGRLPSRFAVEDTAIACIGLALAAAARLHLQRGGTVADVRLDRGHVAVAVRSERYFSRDEQSQGVGFSAVSRFWRAADGWVRTHGNYAWHCQALLSALRADDDVASVEAAIAQLPALDVEERVFAAGGIAAAVRSLDDWRQHPQGRAIAAEPLIHHRVIGAARPRSRPSSGELPASGLRVLDLTRVIAGPVCTRFLAALGADVLRIDPPHRPDMRPGEIADSLLGKRSAIVDLSSKDGAAAIARLLEGADVIVCGYRPGALDAFGLDEQSLAERHGGLVVVYLDAWGHSGPWSGRRGFDSVVQAPSGIALGESRDGDAPGALPCQLLDHGTGYLAAAAVLDGLHRQAEVGGTHIRRLSLARTAWWLVTNDSGEAGAAAGAPGDDVTDWLVEVPIDNGLAATAVAPPGALDGRPLQWPGRLVGYGNAPAEWFRGGVSGG
jgi:crotonobetainyl-CoA:carnitine CoA-transferase CaiB-like acyl-CoA transferase